MPTTVAGPARHSTLLASDRLHAAALDSVPWIDRARRGAVAARQRPGVVRRAEHSEHGPLIFEAARDGDATVVTVWGPSETTNRSRAAALDAARAWVGWHDPNPCLATIVASNRPLSHAARFIPRVRLSRLPRVTESVGRAVLGQLVQAVEAHRSTAQLAALAGTAAGGGLWAWPTGDTLARTPAYAMRRCGINLKGAVAIQRAALDEAQLERVRDDFAALDRRLRAIPGIGVWTSGETRGALGDPDAVSVGDLHLPSIVCHALVGVRGDDCTDDLMLELLEPFRGQRGRVIRLVTSAVRRGLLPSQGRRGPRAAPSVHRYW